MIDIQDNYYRGSDLSIPHIKKISTEIKKVLMEDDYMAYLDTFLRNDEWRKKIKEDNNHKEPEDIIKQTLKELKIAFNKVFEDIASRPEYGGLEYNTPYDTEIWLNIIFGPQDFQIRGGSSDRKHYWVTDFIQRQKKQGILEKKKIKKPKVRLPLNHKLLTQESFEEVKDTYFQSLDKVLDGYYQKFSLDKKNPQAVEYFINKYFTFIFVNTLLKSKLVFECKSKKGNDFLTEMFGKTVCYLGDKIGHNLNLDTLMLQRKFFSNLKNDFEGPLELTYANAEIDDIQVWEEYLAIHYFGTEDETAKSIRRQIMAEYGKGLDSIDKTFELRNPGYYAYQDQIDGASNWIKNIEPGEKQEVLVLLPAIFKDIDTYRQKQKQYETRIEQDHQPSEKNPSPTLTEIQQKYLKYYKVPIQFWPLFGIILYKYNHYYQIRSNIFRKREEYHDLIQKLALDPTLPPESIILCINEFITNKQIKEKFNAKRNQKQIERKQQLLIRIQKEHEYRIKKIIQKEAIKNSKGDKDQMSLELKQ